VWCMFVLDTAKTCTMKIFLISFLLSLFYISRLHGQTTITTAVTPDTICAGGGASVHLTFTLSDSLSTSNYLINLLDSNNSTIAAWSVIDSEIVNGCILQIPTNIPGGHCYKWVVDRQSPPAINGTITGCFYVENCPHTISTQQPPATYDTNNPICAGTTLQIPFFSTGTYGNLNTYYGELSDSAGNFSLCDTVNIYGFQSNQAYPPSGSPGNLLGQIPTGVPAGCNYYLRVVSDTPHVIGTSFGPFCIQHCNISSPPSTGGGSNRGNPVVIKACIKSCQRDPGGFDYSLQYNVNNDANVHFSTGNKFEIELLSTHDLSPIDTSLFGVVVDTVSGTITLHVPCADTLCNLNLLNPSFGGPDYFVRLLATNVTPADSNLGPLIFLQIGYPDDSLYLQPYPYTYTFCANGTPATFYPYPYNFCTDNWNSPLDSYTWYEDNTLIPNITGPGISFPYPEGTYTVSCMEENNGCYSNLANAVFTVDVPPSVLITGPLTICQGDTGTYSVPLTNNTYYTWKTDTGCTIIDTLQNTVKIKFEYSGLFKIQIEASDILCGLDSAYRYVSVTECSTGYNTIKNIASHALVYPNPSKGDFTIVTDQLHIQSITVTDLLGEVLFTQNCENEQGKTMRHIDLEKEGAGIYLLKIKSTEGIFTQKIVVE